MEFFRTFRHAKKTFQTCLEQPFDILAGNSNLQINLLKFVDLFGHQLV